MGDRRRKVLAVVLPIPLALLGLAGAYVGHEGFPWGRERPAPVLPAGSDAIAWRDPAREPIGVKEVGLMNCPTVPEQRLAGMDLGNWVKVGTRVRVVQDPGGDPDRPRWDRLVRVLVLEGRHADTVGDMYRTELRPVPE